MSWNFDLTTTAQADLVGLEPVVHDATMGAIAEWAFLGPPCQGERNVGGMTFYEATIAERFLMAYVVNNERRHFAILWLREKPLGQSSRP